MVRRFWLTFREVLIIVLALVVGNAFPGFMESTTADKNPLAVHFSLANLLMMTTFLIIVFRFGFANIMLAEELSQREDQLTVLQKINQFVSFVILSFSALMLGLMSYYVNWMKYGATMYVLFVVLCMVDCVWDISSWLIDRTAKFRLEWLTNKLAYIAVVMFAWWAFKDDFDPFSRPPEGNVVWGHVFFFLIVVTWLSSFVSLVVGRRLFFPFLFQSSPATPPPPPLLARDQ